MEVYDPPRKERSLPQTLAKRNKICARLALLEKVS